MRLVAIFWEMSVVLILMRCPVLSRFASLAVLVGHRGLFNLDFVRSSW